MTTSIQGLIAQGFSPKGRQILSAYTKHKEYNITFPFCQFLNIILSIQKKIRPPTRFAIIVSNNFVVCNNERTIARIGVESCHLNKYKRYFFFILHTHSLNYLVFFLIYVWYVQYHLLAIVLSILCCKKK